MNNETNPIESAIGSAIDSSNDSANVEVFVQPKLKDRAFIETPCPTSWDKMTGDDSVRFCNMCNLNVYNIANLTDKEAELVFAKGLGEGRLCARLYRRPDGTIMTDNCPRPLRQIRNASKWAAAKIVACFSLILSIAAPAQAQDKTHNQSQNKSAEQNQSAEQNNSSKQKSDSKQNKSVKGSAASTNTSTSTKSSNPTEGQVKMGEVSVPIKTTEPAILGKVRCVPTPEPQANTSGIKPDKSTPDATSTNSPKTDTRKYPQMVPNATMTGRIRVAPPADKKAK